MNKQEKKILFVLSAMSFIIMYIEAMMIPALPQILMELDYSISPAVLSWIITGYLLMAAISMPILAKLGDRYGKKLILLISIIIYAFSVSLSGFQTIYINLIILRVFQGIGAGVFPLSYSIISENYDKADVGFAQGILSSMFALGASFGIIIGAIIDYNLNWQWAYHFVTPFVFIILFLVFLYVPNDKGINDLKLDFFGLMNLSFGILFFIFAITDNYNLYYIFSLFFIILFLINEKISASPFISLNLLRKRNVLIANILAFFIGSAQFLFYQPIILLLTNPGFYGYNYNYIIAGLIILPYSLAMLFVSPIAGILLRKISKKKLLIFGSFLMSIGYILLSFYHNNIFLIILYEILVSSGLGIALVVSINLLTYSVPKETVSVNTGINMVSRTIGGVIGGTISGIILTRYQYYFLPNIYALPILLPNGIAFSYTFILGSVFALFSFFFSLFIESKT